MKKLPSAATLRRLFRYDRRAGALTRRVAAPNSPAGLPITCQDERGRVVVMIGGVNYKAHRVIWKMVTGREPPLIAHDNGFLDDNRWRNLVVTTPSRMAMGAARVDNTSGTVGVSRRGSRWRAQIKKNGRTHNLGDYPTLAEAARARRAAERRLFP